MAKAAEDLLWAGFGKHRHGFQEHTFRGVLNDQTGFCLPPQPCADRLGNDDLSVGGYSGGQQWGAGISTFGKCASRVESSYAFWYPESRHCDACLPECRSG